MSSEQRRELPLEWLYRWEREQPNSTYLTQPYGGGKVREWSWAQTADETRRMAAYLRSLDLEPRSRVAIVSRNCAWWIMADLAIWMAGHVSVPVYPSLKAQSIRAILEHSQSRVCFVGVTDEADASMAGIPDGVQTIAFPTVAGRQTRGWSDIIAANEPLSGHPVRDADDLATVIYTSGTTGTPKGVMHRFGALAWVAQGLNSLYHLNTGQRFFSYLPLAHIVERSALEMASLLLGAPVFFTEGIDTFLTDLQRARATIFASVPRLLLKFQQGVFAKLPRAKLDLLLKIPILNYTIKRKILRQLGLHTVQHAASGAAPLPPEILLWYRRLGLELAEGYGMTETLITHLPPPGRVRPGYVGCALDGVECRLADNGELLIRSPMNMVGYFREPVASAEAFTADRFFRTGDLARIDTDGQLALIGRIKEQFKTSKGKYVAPAPIECQINAHPAVESCCLMGAGLPSPFAVVVLSPEAVQRCAEPNQRKQIEQSLALCMHQINLNLDSHEQLSFIAVVDGPWSVSNGLMTPTLKVKRHALEGTYSTYIEEWCAQNRPVVWESQRQSTMGAA